MDKQVRGPRFINDKDRTRWDDSPHGTRDTLLIIAGIFVLCILLGTYF